ncbi:uncharacterized protein V1510DRAFT_370690 [Dipodascopsis tothii]|uniref:uncharacterized protein n=1 Tax=Dipodascopsis tothii TaxID=44089 RepID=UPI0034CF2A43
MCKWKFSILALCLLISFVDCNIEQVRFFSSFPTRSSVNDESYVSSQALHLSLKDPVFKTVVPKFAQTMTTGLRATEERYELLELERSNLYEFRACWPANSPLDLSVSIEVVPNDANQYSKGGRIFAVLKYSAFYHTEDADLMRNPDPVTITLHFTKCTLFLILGDSILMQLSLIAVVFLSYHTIAPRCYSKLKSLYSSLPHSKNL